jgi:uncharacterized Rossmann fold enzyme
LPLYDEICTEFGFSRQADLESAKLLSGIVGSGSMASYDSLKKKIPKRVLLCGGGDSLEDELSATVYDGFIVAADGATTTLLESEFEVDMIVTDLDGLVEDQIDQSSEGAVVFVHAHGDNMPAVKRYAKKFTGPVVGTCQCAPLENLINHGGFTDGDRAACICSELGVREIVLAGFDFENPSEKAGRSAGVKRRKLAWAKRIMDMVAGEGVRISRASDVLK